MLCGHDSVPLVRIPALIIAKAVKLPVLSIRYVGVQGEGDSIPLNGKAFQIILVKEYT